METNINNIDMQLLYNLIKELQRSINQKEDDLKNIINEKDLIINNLSEKISNQGKRIQNNENEIKKLSNKIEANENEILVLNNKIEENKNEIKNLNKKIEELIINNEKKFMEKENKIDAINNKLSNNEKKILQINENLNEKEKKKIVKCFTNITLKEKIYKELCQLEYLETEYGFLSSIGIKIKYPENNNEIEGFIKAPDNSPYRNGIFNFIIKYQNDYPNNSPNVLIKTKIFHCNVTESQERSDLDNELKRLRNESIDLPIILCNLYEFFAANNPDSPYRNDLAHLFRQNYSKFVQECQLCINQYGSRNFNTNLNYLFEGKYNPNNNSSNSFCYLVLINRKYQIMKINKAEILEVRPVNEFLKKYGLFNNERMHLIIGNTIIHGVIDIKECPNKSIFIFPNLLPWSF